MRDTDPVQDPADRVDDAFRDLFSPLRTPVEASDEQLRAVRADAQRGAPGAATAPRGPEAAVPRGGGARRLVLSGAGGLAVIAIAAGAVIAVDGGRPGTFVGEADAQQVLRAAADASRDDPAPEGWRLGTTVWSSRSAYVGRRCSTCATERGVLEDRRVSTTWSGPRGELYVSVDFEPARAVENEPLLQKVGLVGRRLTPGGAVHLRSLTEGPLAASVLEDLYGIRKTLADPAAVPDEPEALLRWVRERRAEAHRESAAQRAHRLAHDEHPVESDETAIAWDLVDVATSTQLSGRQQAAAFDALSTRPGVTVVPTSAALAAPGRVTVRIAAVAGEGADVPDPSELDRFVVFDGGTHRVVGEFHPAKLRGLSNAPARVGDDGARVELQIGTAGGETVYEGPVDVSGPGLDGDGRRLLELSSANEISRRSSTDDGSSR
jgi:hypothetical protein